MTLRTGSTRFTTWEYTTEFTECDPSNRSMQFHFIPLKTETIKNVSLVVFKYQWRRSSPLSLLHNLAHRSHAIAHEAGDHVALERRCGRRDAKVEIRFFSAPQWVL
jgi:hypothetical protein